MQRKRSTEEEESATAVQREMKRREEDWSNETGFNQVCLFLTVAFVRVFLRLPSVAVTWFPVVKSRWRGEGAAGETTTSLWLSSQSLHLIVLPVCLHRFFGGGAVRGGVTGRPGIPEYWYFAFFSEGFRIYKTANKSKVSTSHGLNHTCSSNSIKNYNLRNKDTVIFKLKINAIY